MITLPPSCTLDDAVSNLPGAVVWATPSVARRLADKTGWKVTTEVPQLDHCDWLVAAGGGGLIDRAKLLRSKAPTVRLAALPTLWGSGAEASPIAVWTQDGRKKFRMDSALLPDLVIRDASFAALAPVERRRAGFGDCWSHALEGFLSPLGTEETRHDLAEVLARMAETPENDAPAWLELSALACAGQARTSVGLVHGIAHTLEAGLGWDHAALCALFLLPVMRFNQAHSPKWPLLAQSGLDETRIMEVSRDLFDSERYAKAVPALAAAWGVVVRDPCTRTNSALVRASDADFFVNFLP